MMDGKKILGGFLILIAVISILGFVNIVDAGAIFSTYWPVVIMLAGVAQMINKNLIGGGIVLLFGIWFQLDKTNHTLFFVAHLDPAPPPECHMASPFRDILRFPAVSPSPAGAPGGWPALLLSPVLSA